MNAQTQPTAAEQIGQLNANLTKAYIEKDEAAEKLKASEAAILAIRNVLAGVQVGQRLQMQIAAEEHVVQTA